MLPEIVLGENTKAGRVKPNSHTDAVLTLSWNSLQPNLSLSGSADTSIKLWDLNNQQASIHTPTILQK